MSGSSPAVFFPAIVIPAFRRADLVVRCLKSLAYDGYDGLRRVLVVEDDAPDPEFERAVRSAYPELDLLTLGRNRGFAAAANAGIERSLALPEVTHVVMLNSDTSVVHGWLPVLGRAMTIEGWDWVVPRMCSMQCRDVIDGDGDCVDKRGLAQRRHRGQLTGEVDACRMPVAFPTGGSSLVSREAYEAVGLFDERLGMYYEDVDWGLRALAIGLSGGVEPSALVFHEGSGTSGRAMALQCSFNNYVVVTLTRMPPAYFRSFIGSWAAGVIRSFAYLCREAGAGPGVLALVTLLRVLPTVPKRRSELSWSSTGEHRLRSFITSCT